MRHGHAATVPQITLRPLVAPSTEDGLVGAGSGRLQIIAVVYLVHTARSTALSAVSALLLIFKEVVGSFLGIRWIQSLVQELLWSALVPWQACSLLFKQ